MTIADSQRAHVERLERLERCLVHLRKSDGPRPDVSIITILAAAYHLSRPSDEPLASRVPIC